jgi:hypothetical protein
MIVDYWYDSHTKSWVVQRKNKRGDQIGNADHVYTKEEALRLAKEYEEEFDIEYKERSPFPELSDLPKVFIGDVELNPRDFRIGKLKKSKRVTKFSRYGR